MHHIQSINLNYELPDRKILMSPSLTPVWATHSGIDHADKYQWDITTWFISSKHRTKLTGPESNNSCTLYMQIANWHSSFLLLIWIKILPGNILVLVNIMNPDKTEILSTWYLNDGDCSCCHCKVSIWASIISLVSCLSKYPLFSLVFIMYDVCMHVWYHSNWRPGSHLGYKQTCSRNSNTTNWISFKLGAERTLGMANMYAHLFSVRLKTWRHGGHICFLTPMITLFWLISRKLCKIGD